MWFVYAGVAYLAYRYLAAPEAKKRKKRAKQRPHPPPTRGGPDPYVVLEVSPSATMDEVRHAYQRKVSSCHPDRVASGPDDVRAAAEAETKRLNLAYDTIRRQRQG